MVSEGLRLHLGVVHDCLHTSRLAQVPQAFVSSILTDAFFAEIWHGCGEFVLCCGKCLEPVRASSPRSRATGALEGDRASRY